MPMTPTAPERLTPEDLAIILKNPGLDTVIGMLVGDTKDSRLMFDWEWDKYYIKRQQWELDYVF